MAESMRFGPITVAFDDHVLRPRPWTVAQSTWAAELLADARDGPLLELCAGAGQIGLVLASLVPRRLVQIEADAHACAYARANAAAAGLSGRVEVRNGLMQDVVAAHERFALVVADPPWVPTCDTDRFPSDPVRAIDGGDDGLDLARTCVDVIDRHLARDGASILQLGDAHQVAAMRAYLDSRPDIGLSGRATRTPSGGGVLLLLTRD